MMPAFIMIGSRIMPAISAGVLGERPLDGAEVVEGDDDDQVHDRLRDAGVAGHARRRSAGPTSSASGSTETCTESWWPW